MSVEHLQSSRSAAPVLPILVEQVDLSTKHVYLRFARIVDSDAELRSLINQSRHRRPQFKADRRRGHVGRDRAPYEIDCQGRFERHFGWASETEFSSRVEYQFGLATVEA